MAIEKRFRKSLNEIAKSVPHHDLGRIGDSVSNIETRRIRQYRIQIESVYENRKVVELESPSDSLFEKSLIPFDHDEFDVWSLTLFAPDNLAQQPGDHRIEESVTVAVCGDCSGLGRFACNTCSQSGVQQCLECGGKGWVICNVCHGRYRFHPTLRSCKHCFMLVDELELGVANRFYCENSGEYQFSSTWWSGGANRCPTCKASLKHECVDCNGSGSLICGRCNGRKHIARFLVVRRAYHVKGSCNLIADRNCPADVQEQLQSEHFELVKQLKANAFTSGGNPTVETSQIVEHLEARLLLTLSEELKSLWESILQLSLQAPKAHGRSTLTEQRLSIFHAHVHEVTYRFRAKTFTAWLTPNTIIAPQSPFIDRMKEIASEAKQIWPKDADRAVEEFHKCFVMGRKNPDFRQALMELSNGAVPRDLYAKAASLETVVGKVGSLFRRVAKRLRRN